MISNRFRLFMGIGAAAAMFACANARTMAQPEPGTFATPVLAANVDPTAYAVWANGTETAVGLPQDGPTHALWTASTAPQWDGVHFGEGKSPGKRHLRIGWKSAISVGTILTRGDITVSVLRASAAYPGVLANDTQWISAFRLKGRRQTALQPQQEEYALWVLPPGTTSRAVRFTHNAELTDTSFAGWLGGAYVLPQRLCNVAPAATVETRANSEKAGRIIDESNNNTWNAWDNTSDAAFHIAPDRPEWIRLTWPTPVTLTGLNALWAGFGAVDVQEYIGPANRHPALSVETDWKSIRSFSTLDNQYPRSLGVNWLDFGRTVTTRALRLLITAPTREQHPHLNGNIKNGTRIWLGELLAIHAVTGPDLATSLPPPPPAAVPAQIPIHFKLASAGHVTLVIEDPSGKRVRNLISDASFPAGANTVWWDGTDDLGRDPDASRHGIYHIPTTQVKPGVYHVRGLVHSGIKLRYEFSLYSAGHPVWETADHTGGWLSNHTPPSSVLFVPQAPDKPTILAGSYVTEGGSGLAWLDLDGRKRDGKGWIGGNWTGAPYLARDRGEHPVPDVYAYAAAAWGELRLTALKKSGDTPVLQPTYKFPGEPQDDHNPNSAVTGIAVHNGILVAALPKLSRLFVVDARAGKQIGTIPVNDPRGIAFDKEGGLLVLSGRSLLRFAPGTVAQRLMSTPQRIIGSELEDPQGIALDDADQIYITDQGNSHQVKVFSKTGQVVRNIGHAGAPAPGTYDPLHMNHPLGVTIDNAGKIWVAENDFQPKRLSVWSAEGKLLQAFYGPAEYGGGGTLDPRDKSRFLFHGMEFKLDWKTGTSQLTTVFYRPEGSNFPYPDGFGVGAPPETPVYAHGKRYLSNCYNSNPTNGAPIAMLWLYQAAIAKPVAAMGRANEWSLLKTDPFKHRWPTGINLKGDTWQNETVFQWYDQNGDGQVQPAEVTMWKGSIGGITVMPDLTFVTSRLNDVATAFSPQNYTAADVPVYSPTGKALVKGAQGAVSSGGDQALTQNGWTILTNAPKPFSPYGIGGAKNGVPLWSYPSLWPGLHASHESPAPEFPGELIGTTRLLGGFVTPTRGNAGPVFCINGNMGNMYMLTADGMFVSTLFQDVRQGATWTMPSAPRGMLLNALTLHDENFWPSIMQAEDGNIYLNASHPSLVRVDGLESVRRLPEATIHVTVADLKRSAESIRLLEIERQKQRGVQRIVVNKLSSPPTLSNELKDWSSAEWASIDKRGVAAFFDSNSKPYNVSAAISVSGDRLYAAFRTADPELLRNSGDNPLAAFKTGGALDLMLGAVDGGERLLVTRVKGKTLAVLYRQKGTTPHGAPMAFSSPWRTLRFDSVEDVSNQVELTDDGKGNYQLSAPLVILGLNPATGATIKGDLGILRGNGFQTLQRVYWSNKATGIVADVPSEAELSPTLWGSFEFR